MGITYNKEEKYLEKGDKTWDKVKIFIKFEYKEIFINRRFMMNFHSTLVIYIWLYVT